MYLPEESLSGSNVQTYEWNGQSPQLIVMSANVSYMMNSSGAKTSTMHTSMYSYIYIYYIIIYIYTLDLFGIVWNTILRDWSFHTISIHFQDLRPGAGDDFASRGG